MSPSPLTLYSCEDSSANFIMASGAEARYVRRDPDYFIVYLSSHSGCNQACRMCHLTQTGQTDMTPQSLDEIFAQASRVLDHYKWTVAPKHPAMLVHFNFMARGEPLLSPVITEQWNELALGLQERAAQAGVFQIRINVSTTMPVGGVIPKAFGSASMPRIYYSLYSSNPAFRRRWLPNAMPVEDALAALADWQRDTHGSLTLHWALIEGENDSLEEAEGIGKMVEHMRLHAKFNLVRYNPYSEAQGKEPSEERLLDYFDTIVAYTHRPGSRIVPRVGFDVKASCGCFVDIGGHK